jgi:N-acetylmuramic acid 6-phosphate etherase
MLQDLLTETRNSASNAIDRLPTAELLEVINQADRDVPDAVAKVIPEITRAVDAIVERMRNQGRLFYMGAGTSGRLGVLDASECPPTFNVPPDLVQGIIAGGGRNDLQARGFGAGDVLVGIAASGRTPYVLGAVAYAHSLGALTVALSCTPDSELARAAEIAITPVPGPEIITGSTRMRAGTATKLVLNMISTGVMIRLGYVYGNLMVNVQPTNGKLADRARRIIAVIAGISTEDAGHLLDKAGSVRVAIVMHKFGIGRSDAEARLNAAQGRLRAALGENE